MKAADLNAGAHVTPEQYLTTFFRLAYFALEEEQAEDYDKSRNPGL